MVVDTIGNAARYGSLGARIKRALELLATAELRGKAPGRYEVEGSDLYYIVQSYTTKLLAEGSWESHRSYIDLQYVLEGTERMGWSPVALLRVTQPYDPGKDAAFYAGGGDFILAGAGTFFLLWPEDAHMPGMAVDAPSPVRKVVVKVRI